jgi:hypothetical protein
VSDRLVLLGILIVAAEIWYLGSRIRQLGARIESHLASLGDAERIREVDDFNHRGYPHLFSRAEDWSEMMNVRENLRIWYETNMLVRTTHWTPDQHQPLWLEMWKRWSEEPTGKGAFGSLLQTVHLFKQRASTETVLNSLEADFIWKHEFETSGVGFLNPSDNDGLTTVTLHGFEEALQKVVDRYRRVT